MSVWVFVVQMCSDTPTPTITNTLAKMQQKGAKCVCICMDWALQCEDRLFNILLAMSQHFPGLFSSLHGAMRALREKHLKSIYPQIQYIREPFCLSWANVMSNMGDGISLPYMWQLARYVAVTWHTEQECCYESPESPSVQPKGKTCPSWPSQLHIAISLCHICFIQVEKSAAGHTVQLSPVTPCFFIVVLVITPTCHLSF